MWKTREAIAVDPLAYNLCLEEDKRNSNRQKIRINASGCLDHCEFGPTMVIYPDNIWYTCKSESDVDLVINEHLINDRVVENLLIKKWQFLLYQLQMELQVWL